MLGWKMLFGVFEYFQFNGKQFVLNLSWKIKLCDTQTTMEESTNVDLFFTSILQVTFYKMQLAHIAVFWGKFID